VKITQRLPVWLLCGVELASRHQKCENRHAIIRFSRQKASSSAASVMFASMASTHKKVIVRKNDRDCVNGFVAPANFVVDGKLELLNTTGNVVTIDLRDIKAVYFVRDFSDTDVLARKTFTTRPRTEGLWVRLKFKDNDIIEGILPNDLAQNPAEGFLVNPPDLRSNTQRIFIPRNALASLNVLAVIGAARRRKRGPADVRQASMFE